MTYARIEDNKIVEFPLYVVDIEIRHNRGLDPKWEGGRLQGIDYVYVHSVEPPTDLTPTQRFIVGPPALQPNGEWHQVWTVEDIPQSELDEIKERLEKLEKAKVLLIDNGINPAEVQEIINNMRWKNTIIANNQPTTEGLNNL